jgi:hypothetical protein
MTNAPKPAAGRTPFVAAQTALSLVAAALFAVRAVRTASGDGLPPDHPATAGVLLAATALLLSVGAGALALRSTRLAALPLAAVLSLELVVLDDHVAPPRLLAALPLMGALALALVPRAPGRPPHSSSNRTRQVLTAVALVLMAPIGFFYLTTGLVAPAPDVFGAYAVFGLLVAVAVHLARRRSWWVLTVPPVSVALWFLMLWVGESVLGWSA